MNQSVDPKQFGLHPSSKIEQVDGNHFILRIERKSRIIMKDGEKILEKVAAIQASVPDAVVSVLTTAPVCSKTKRFLEDHDVRIEYS
jgi:hypothetical protein